MKDLAEIIQIRDLMSFCDDPLIEVVELGRVQYKKNSYPLIGFIIGSDGV